MNTTNSITSPRNWNKLVTAVITAEAGCHGDNYEKMKHNLTTARAELKDAFVAAGWGTNGAIFVSNRRSDWGGGYRKSLYMNGRLRATYDYHSWDDDVSWIEVFSAEEAEKTYYSTKEGRRAAAAAYEKERHLLLADLYVWGHMQCASFADWEYLPGQEGGVFRRGDSNLMIGALGALRGAWGDNWWDMPTEDPHTRHEREWDVRLYGARW